MTGQTAIVTGANGDMGHAICEALVAAGHTVVGVDLGDAGRGSYAYRRCDLSDLTQIEALIDATGREFGTVRTLVNNAGVWGGKTFLDITPAVYDRTFAVNARALFFATQMVVRRLLAAKLGGSIVNISSIAATGNSPITDYSGSKAAVVTFTKSLAKALGPHGIRVNAIAPGFIDTAMARLPTPERRREIEAGISLRRAGEPREIGDTVAFLVSEKASYITGANIGVDGGLW